MYESVTDRFKNASLAMVSFWRYGVRMYFSNYVNSEIQTLYINRINIEPCDFPCPKNMSLHTQMTWFNDTIYQFIEKKVIDIKIIENESFTLEFENGKIIFEIDGDTIEILADANYIF